MENGGAIYAAFEHRVPTVHQVEALFIEDCRANEAGGAAYGLSHSQIKAMRCSAQQGGAVACCENSRVEALLVMQILPVVGLTFVKTCSVRGYGETIRHRKPRIFLQMNAPRVTMNTRNTLGMQLS